jgi:hypothetical protein
MTRFRRALVADDGAGAYAAATELRHIELADALSLTLLLADDWKVYERASVRWVARFALEVLEVPVPSTHLALAAVVARQGPCGRRSRLGGPFRRTR